MLISFSSINRQGIVYDNTLSRRAYEGDKILLLKNGRKFTLSKEIGEGEYGIVYNVQNDDSIVAKMWKMGRDQGVATDEIIHLGKVKELDAEGKDRDGNHWALITKQPGKPLSETSAYMNAGNKEGVKAKAFQLIQNAMVHYAEAYHLVHEYVLFICLLAATSHLHM